MGELWVQGSGSGFRGFAGFRFAGLRGFGVQGEYRGFKGFGSLVTMPMHLAGNSGIFGSGPKAISHPEP